MVEVVAVLEVPVGPDAGLPAAAPALTPVGGDDVDAAAVAPLPGLGAANASPDALSCPEQAATPKLHIIHRTN